MSDNQKHDLDDLLGVGTDQLFGERRGVTDIELEKLEPNPYQPRKSFAEGEIEELAASIQESGLLQPITVAEKPSELGRYYIVMGERRYRAHQHLERETIRALIVEWKPDQAAVNALVENLQREDLDPLELAEGVRRLMDEHDLSQVKVAKRLGKSRTSINQLLRLLDLPEDIRTEAREQELSQTMLVEVAQIEDENEQRRIWQRVKSGAITSRNEIRNAKAARRDNPPKKPASVRRPATDKTLESLTRGVSALERLANDDVTLDPARVQEFQRLFERLGEALQQVQQKGEGSQEE